MLLVMAVEHETLVRQFPPTNLNVFKALPVQIQYHILQAEAREIDDDMIKAFRSRYLSEEDIRYAIQNCAITFMYSTSHRFCAIALAEGTRQFGNEDPDVHFLHSVIQLYEIQAGISM
jgi:hypothetical protein